MKGPADRMLARLAGGTTPAHVASCYTGLIDVLVIDEADAPADLEVETVVTKTLMTDAEARRRLVEAALGWRGLAMRVAVLGGTGSFGVALARRLVEAGAEVVIGSRDAERARAAAAELGCEGATNAEAARSADLVFLAVKADAALETAREHAEAIGETPVFSVAAELTFSPTGVRPTPEARSLAERIQDVVRGPVVAGLHSLAATNLGAEDAARGGRARLRRRPCGEGARARARRPPRPRARRRRGAARERARARGHDRGDRQRQQALQGPRRAPPERPAVSDGLRVLPVLGLPEVREGDDLAALISGAVALEDGDVLVVAQKAVSKAEGRVVALDGPRAVGAGARARRRRGARRAAHRGDPAGVRENRP